MPLEHGQTGELADAWGTPAPDADEQKMLAELENPAPEPVPEPTPEPVEEPVEEPAPELEAEPAQELEEEEPDPAAFQDTRERKDSYTAKEYADAVRARDYFRRSYEEQQRRQQVVEERLERISGALEKQLNPPAPVPSLEQDPAAHLAHKQAELGQQVGKVTEYIENQEVAQREAQQQQQFLRAVEAAEAAHVRETGSTLEDFRTRVGAVRQAKIQDVMLEEGMDEASATRWVMEVWEPHIVRNRMQRGENPAAFYDQEFSRRRLAPLGAETPTPGGAGTTGRNVGQAEADNIERIRQGRKASRSAGGAGGATGVMKVNYETLAEMDPGEFDAVMDRIEKMGKADALHMGETVTLSSR